MNFEIIDDIDSFIKTLPVQYEPRTVSVVTLRGDVVFRSKKFPPLAAPRARIYGRVKTLKAPTPAPRTSLLAKRSRPIPAPSLSLLKATVEPKPGLSVLQVPITGHLTSATSQMKAGPRDHEKVCSECGKVFMQKCHLTRHMKTHTGKKSCDVCQKGFSRRGDLNRHVCSMHQNVKELTCGGCNKIFARSENLAHYIKVETCQRKRKATPTPAPSSKRSRKSATLGVFTTKRVESSKENCGDLLECFEEVRFQLLNNLTEKIQEMGALKWYVVIKVQMTRASGDGEEDTVTTHFRSKVATELSDTDLSEHISQAFVKISRSFDEFTQ